MSRNILILLSLLIVAGCGSYDRVPVVDCHVHLWDISRTTEKSWPRKEHTQYFRNYLPEQIVPAAKAADVKGIVALQSGQRIADNQWNLDIIKDYPLFKGVVGNFSILIGTDGFAPLFNKLCEDERYLGYRLSGRYKEGLSDELIRDLKLTAAKGKSVDFLVGGYSWDEIMIIADKIPNLRIVVDHFGGVTLHRDKKLDPEWVKGFKKLAKHKNIHCKVSALYGRFKEQPAPQELKYYKEILDLAWNSFGEDRLIYSSDWPVTEQTGDYASVVKLTKSYFKPKGRAVMMKVFYTNAVKFYRIPGL